MKYLSTLSQFSSLHFTAVFSTPYMQSKTTGSRILFLQNNQGTPVYCHRQDLPNITHLRRKWKYFLYTSWLWVIDKCSYTKCSTLLMMLHNVLFCIQWHIFQYYSITQKCPNLTESTFQIKRHTHVVWTWLVMGCNAIHRACGLVKCRLTVFLYRFSPCRQTSWKTWGKSHAETFQQQLQGDPR